VVTIVIIIFCDVTHGLKSKLLFDRRSVGQSILMSGAHLGSMTRFLLMSAVSLMWGRAISDERAGLYFTVVAGPL
jgi:hypothetical protein